MNCTKSREDWCKRAHSFRKLKVMLGSASRDSNTVLGLKRLGRSSCNLALLWVDSFRGGTGALRHLGEVASYSLMQSTLNLERTLQHEGPLTDGETPRALEDVAGFKIPKNPFSAHLFQVKFLLPVLTPPRKPSYEVESHQFPPSQATC